MPLVVRSAVGAGGSFGAMHSQIPATWLQGVPGLKMVVPVDAGRRQGAAQGGDPRRQPGRLPRAQAALLGQGPGRRARRRCRSARPRRPRGRRRDDRLDLQGRRRRARGGRRAAERRHRRRGRRPAHACARSTSTTVLESVARTNRVVAVEEGPMTGGWAAGLLGAVAEEGLHDLDDAWIVATPRDAGPYSPTLEDDFLPDARRSPARCASASARASGKPSGPAMTAIQPQLFVRRGRAAVDFYRDAFGAAELYRVGGTDEHEPVVAQLAVGDAASGSPTRRRSTATTARRRSAAHGPADAHRRRPARPRARGRARRRGARVRAR